MYFSNFADQRLYRQTGRRAPPVALTPARLFLRRLQDGPIEDAPPRACGKTIVRVTRSRRPRSSRCRTPRRERSRPASCSSRAPTSIRIRSCRRTASTWRGCSGTIPTCRGTAPSCGRRRFKPRRHARRADANRRRRRRIDLPAGMVARWRALLRLGSHRLVEPLSAEGRTVRPPRRRTIEPLHPMEAEFGKPQWTFSMVDLCLRRRDAHCRHLRRGRPLEAGVHRDRSRALGAGRAPPGRDRRRCAPTSGRCISSAARRPRRSPWSRMTLAAMEPEAFRRSSASRSIAGFDARPWISAPHRPGRPVHLSVPERRPTRDVARCTPSTTPPKNPDFAASGRRRLRRCWCSATAGRPAATEAVLDAEIQFWTSRGFAVLDVNYSGSTGYGRAYRERLNGQWGIVDVEDAVAGARGDGRGRQGRSGAADHPRRQRRRLHDAGRADVPRHVQGRRQLLRHQRPRGAGARHAQVRVALPRLADRPVSGGAGPLRGSARRSTSPTGCRAR